MSDNRQLETSIIHLDFDEIFLGGLEAELPLITCDVLPDLPVILGTQPLQHVLVLVHVDVQLGEAGPNIAAAILLVIVVEPEASNNPVAVDK